MSRAVLNKAERAGRYTWREKDGKLRGVDIIRPKKRPTSTSVAEIRRAIRESHAAPKAK